MIEKGKEWENVEISRIDIISVVVPVYNGEIDIAKCIESLLKQDISKANYRIIIIDDGSTDSTANVIKNYINRNGNERIVYKYQDNSGLSRARNAGIDLLDSDYICFVDSDDYVEPDYLSRLYSLIINTGSDISMCGINRCFSKTGKGKRFDSGFDSDFVSEDIDMVLKHSSFAAWNKLFKRDLWEGLRFPVGMTYEDFATIPIIMNRAHKIAYTNKVLYHYYINQNSIIMNSVRIRKTDRNILKAQLILENSEMANKKDVLENFYIRRVLSSMAYSLYQYKEKDAKQIVAEIVDIGFIKYPNIKKNESIDRLPIDHKLFVKCALSKMYLGCSLITLACDYINMLKQMPKKILANSKV